MLLLTIGGSVFVGMTAKPDYTMTSYVQLIPAKVAPTDNPTSASLRNPWNQLGLNTLGQASIYATQDQKFLDALKAANHTDNFTLTMTYPNPIVTVEVVGSGPADARDTTQLVIDRLRASAESLQRGSGVTDVDMIKTQRLDQGLNLLPSRSKVKRAILAVAAAGLVMTAGGTVGFDALMRRRSRKRKERDQAEAPEQEAPATAVANAPATEVMNAPATGVINGKELPGPKKVPVIPGELADAPDEAISRTGVPPEKPADRPSVVKVMRPPGAATYRSVNVRTEANGESNDAVRPATNGNADAISSDVRIVLQPKRVAGENGGKP